MRLQFAFLQLDGGRQQLCDDRFLAHGRNEHVVHEEQAIDVPFLVRIEHDRHRADQVVNARRIAEVRCRADDVAAHAAEKLHGLGAHQHHIDFDVLFPPAGKLTDHRLEQVCVQPAAQPAVRRDDDQAHTFGLALRQVRVPVVRVGLRQVPDDPTDALRIGARRFHLLLRLADLARRDFFHRARDLLHVLYRSDLRADFFFACHLFAL